MELTTEQIGRLLWKELHSYQWSSEEQARRFFSSWLDKVPKYGCDCQSHFKAILKDTPPDFSSAEAFSEWSVMVHDLVNAKLGKPTWRRDNATTRIDAR